MGDETSNTSSASSSGAPTVSANNTTSTESKPKSESKPESKAQAKGEAKAKQVYAGSRPTDLVATYDKLVVEAKAYNDPLLEGLLAEGEKSARHLEREADQVPVDAGELEALRTSSKALRKAFVAVLRNFKTGLLSVKGGKEFVATHSDDDEVACYRHLAAGLTPAHLGHNRPLLDETEQSFAEYMRVDGDYRALQTRARAQSSRVAEAKRRLFLDLRAIRAAMELADVRQAKAGLGHPQQAA